MKKYLTFISAILTAAVLLSGCGGTADDMTAGETAAAVTEESKTETTFSEVTETETTTETTTEVTTETSKTTMGTGGVTDEGLVVSPSGYVLDPQNVLPEGTSFWYDTSEEVRKSGLAYLLMELSDGETRIYGVCPNEEPYEIIIEHDGIGDEFAETWSTRYGDAAYTDNEHCKLLDMDGDGENEVVMSRYSIGGTLCCIDFLSVYKMEDGHYKRYELDYERLADEYIKTDIDSGANTVTVSIKNSDVNFVYDASETCSEGVKGVLYKNLVSYDIGDGNVKISYCGLMSVDESFSALPLDDMIRVRFTVSLNDDGEFVLSDPEIDVQK